MPPRVSSQALSAHVGRVIFRGQATSKLIAHKLDQLPAEKLKAAMQRRGVGDVSVKKIADVLSGKDRSGMKQHELRRVVEALQDVGVAKQAYGASHMVATASQEIQKGRGLGSLDPHGQKITSNNRDLRGISSPGSSPEPTQEEARRPGIMERMRGVVGEMQKVNRDTIDTSQALSSLQSNPEAHLSGQDQGGIGGLRRSMRQVLGLQEKKLPPPTMGK